MLQNVTQDLRLGLIFLAHLIREPEENRQLWRPRHSWKAEIKIDLKIWCKEDWIHLAQDRDQWQALTSMVTNLWDL
jgi:hypothetical protein